MNLKLAGGIILDDTGKVLLLHRNTPKRTQWEIPGGKVEDGEDTRATTIREIKEELGVDIEVIKKLGEKEFTEDGLTMYYTWYTVKITDGELEIMESQMFDDLRYFSIEEMQKIYKDLSPNTKNFFKLYSLWR